MSFEYSDVVDAGALAGAPGAGGGIMISLTSSADLSGFLENGKIQAYGMGTGSYSVHGHSETQSHNMTISGTVENGVIEGVLITEGAGESSFTAERE